MLISFKSLCFAVALFAFDLTACSSVSNGPVDGGRAGATGGADAGQRGSGGAGGITDPGGVGGMGVQLVYCGHGAGLGGAVGSTPPPAYCPTVDAPPTDAAALRVYQLAEPELHANLERVIGQYVCGGSPLYRGTFAASDNYGNGALDSGPVIASLEPMGTSQVFLTCSEIAAAGRALVVMGTSQQRAMRLFQPANDVGHTYASLINEVGSTWSGTAGSCTGCVVDFRSGSPATIDVTAAEFDGQYCGAADPLTVMATGHLAFLGAPSFDDIMAIGRGFGDHPAAPAFTLQGEDMVATIDGSIVEPTTVAPGYDQCQLITGYHVDWHVQRQNVNLFGLRNFRIDAPQVACCRSGGI
jgi:hypothetical protein